MKGSIATRTYTIAAAGQAAFDGDVCAIIAASSRDVVATAAGGAACRCANQAIG